MPNLSSIPEDMRQPFIGALYKVHGNDYLLIENGCCERSVVLRLGLYLSACGTWEAMG